MILCDAEIRALDQAGMISPFVESQKGKVIGQMLFFRGNPCEVSYKDRGGKYQGQTGITEAQVRA